MFHRHAPLLHPVALLAIAVLLFNDHVGKYAWPGVVTGKVSDFAGLVFFPLFLVSGVELACATARRGAPPRNRTLAVCVVLTAVVFTLVQLDTPMTALYRVGLGALQWPARAVAALIGGRALPALAPVAVWPDPTDLLALPALAIAWWLGSARSGGDPVSTGIR